MKAVNLGPFDAQVSVADGAVSLDLSLAKSLGGGAAEGIVKGSVDLKLEIGAQQGADLAINILEAHFPAEAALLEMVKSGVDTAIKKVTV